MRSHQPWRYEPAYYHGLLPAERHAVDAHLAGCAECRAVLAGFDAQDAALAAIPTLRPRRGWRTQPAQPALRWLNLFGQTLALGGLVALLWMFALQAQYASLFTAGSGTGTPAQPVPQPGIAIPPAVVHLPSPWLPALPWLGGWLLAVGLLFALSGRRLWTAAAGGLLAAGLLITFVPPFSALPNPAGLVWRLVGGYSYDPNLPFKDDFLIAGRPENTLRPYLDPLIGQVGLSPLDPAQPLRAYEILRVGLHRAHNRVVLVTTRFIYADGSSRIYPVPLFDPAQDLRGFWLAGWRNDGLERLRSQHLALEGQPFAGPGDPIGLGPARRLDALSPAANRLDEINPWHWQWSSVRVQHLVWAPNGKSFLAVMEAAPGQRQLWDIALDGSAPRLAAAGDIRQYGWSPDGRQIVLTLFDSAAAALAPDQPFAVQAVPVASLGQAALPLVTRLPSAQLPGLAAEGVWFFSGGSLWQVPYAGGQPRQVLSMPQQTPSGEPRLASDEHLAAFACGPNVCLLPLSSGQPVGDVSSLPLPQGLSPAEMAWSPDGALLAVIERSANPGPAVLLMVANGQGQKLLSTTIAPGEATEAPQWTPDDKTVLVQTYPYQGRRIIAVDVPSGRALDLSQAHLDAYFALSPDGAELLLNNGRGDFWTAPLMRRN